MKVNMDFDHTTFVRLQYLKKYGTPWKQLPGDVLGRISTGGVCCYLFLVEDELFEGCDFGVGGSYAIEGTLYLIGRGHGTTKDGIPYDIGPRFYGHLKDSYGETVSGLIGQFCEIVESDKDMLALALKPKHTWARKEK